MSRDVPVSEALFQAMDRATGIRRDCQSLFAYADPDTEEGDDAARVGCVGRVAGCGQYAHGPRRTAPRSWQRPTSSSRRATPKFTGGARRSFATSTRRRSSRCLRCCARPCIDCGSVRRCASEHGVAPDVIALKPSRPATPSSSSPQRASRTSCSPFSTPSRAAGPADSRARSRFMHMTRRGTSATCSRGSTRRLRARASSSTRSLASIETAGAWSARSGRWPTRPRISGSRGRVSTSTWRGCAGR